MEKLFGGVEAGGTKIICCVGDENGVIRDRHTIKTSSPEKNLPEIFSWFSHYPIQAIGLGWFGPLDLSEGSKSYGTVRNTPKLLWRNCNVYERFQTELAIPVVITTDVNASLLGEVAKGAAVGCKDVIYLTVGTGVGAGILSGGKLLQGVTHPEAGHMLLNRLKGDDYPCGCPYHASCLEGLVSGSAIEKRFRISGKDVPENSFIFVFEAEYLAMALLNYMLILSPQKIILGGGVAGRSFLFQRIREKILSLNNGYLDLSAYGDLSDYLVPAGIGGDQALVGCLYMAAKGNAGK